MGAAEGFCLPWDAGFKAIDLSNLWTQMVTWGTVDLVTIMILFKYPVKYLTRPLQAVLALSIITHCFAAYAWALYNQPYLDVYDNVLKEGIFILEVMVLIFYGIYRGGKRLRVFDCRSGLDDVSGVFSDQGNLQMSDRIQSVAKR